MEWHERLGNHPPEFFAKLSDKELEKRREETERELDSLKVGPFPDYRAIRSLEGDRQAIILELSKRGKLVSPGAFNDEAFQKRIEEGWKALENARQARQDALTPSPEQVARNERLNAFEEKLHQTTMAILDAQIRRVTPAPSPVQNSKSTAVAAGAIEKVYDSRPDVLRRRQIIRNNPKFSAKSLCKVFDAREARVPLPPGWEDKYGVTTWTEAHNDRKARAAIQRIISTDRKALGLT